MNESIYLPEKRNVSITKRAEKGHRREDPGPSQYYPPLFVPATGTLPLRKLRCLRKTVLRSRHRETSSGLPWDQHTSGRPTAGNHLVSLQLPEDSRQLPDKKAQAVCLPRIPIPHTRKSLALRDHFWEFQKIPE